MAVPENMNNEEKLFRAIFEQAAVGMAHIVSRTGQFVRINKRYCDMIGYSSEEIEKLTLQDITHPEDLAANTDNLRSLLSGQIRQFSMEKRYYRKNGSIVWVNLTVSPLWGPGEEPSTHIAIVEDITERKRTEFINVGRLRLLEYAETHSLDKLLEATLDEVETLTDSVIGFYHFVDADQETVSLQNWSTRTKNEFCMAEAKGQHYDVSQAGVWVDCIHQRRPVVYNNYASLPHRKGFPPGHAPVIRELLVPVMRGNKIVAVLGVGNKADEYNDQDVRTVTLFADLAWEIAERKQAEEELQNSRNYLVNIINSIPDPIFVKDRAHRYMLVNDAECSFIGYSREELIGKDGNDFFPKEQVEVFWDKDEIVFETGQENVNEEEITTGEGDKRFIVTKKRLCKDVNGNKYIVGLIRDITEYKVAERELRESEQRYKGLVELFPDAIYVHSGGKLIFANTQGAKLLGVEKPEELYGREALDFVHSDNRDFVQQRINKAFRTGEPNPPTEEQIVRIDGSPVTVEVASVPFAYQGGKALQVIVRDITYKRKMQHEQLKAQKLESLGILAGGIAHDFNNILTGIMGNISIARLQIDSPKKVLQRLELCEKASVQASELTRQLLTFARGGEPVKRIMTLAHLVRDSVSFALRGSNIRSIIELEDGLWNLEADETQLGQVLNNLLLNAVQAMPAGGEITVRADNVKLWHANVHNLPAGDYISVSVEDNGYGIPQENLLRIFDPYFTTKPQGSGLGLASVYSIVKRHGGTIEVSSTLGVGSCFTVYLPAIAGKSLEGTDAKESAELQGSGRVLLMDDEDFVLDIAREILHFVGYEVVTCGNGLEAVEIFRAAREGKNPFSAVILDLTIRGGMGGREAAGLMLEIDPDAVLIVSSGYSDDPVVANFRQYGFSGVISKPFDAEGMVRGIQRALR